jgi:molybdopterin-guanine dinucleotide biosynthesis protein A
MTEHQTASVAILAGGKSRRMGTDKALIRIRAGDETLLERVLARVASLTDDLFVVASNRPEYAAFGVPILPDLYPGGAVLGGIASAIRHARHDRCLVVSCDHPFLSPELLDVMIRWPGDWDVLAPVTAGESRQGGGKIRHTLHAVYGKGCLTAIERRLADGQRQIVSFFADVRVAELGGAVLARHDPGGRSLMSINTPEALEAARALLGVE